MERKVYVFLFIVLLVLAIGVMLYLINEIRKKSENRKGGSILPSPKSENNHKKQRDAKLTEKGKRELKKVEPKGWPVIWVRCGKDGKTIEFKMYETCFKIGSSRFLNTVYVKDPTIERVHLCVVMEEKENSQRSFYVENCARTNPAEYLETNSEGKRRYVYLEEGDKVDLEPGSLEQFYIGEDTKVVVQLPKSHERIPSGPDVQRGYARTRASRPTGREVEKDSESFNRNADQETEEDTYIY